MPAEDALTAVKQTPKLLLVPPSELRVRLDLLTRTAKVRGGAGGVRAPWHVGCGAPWLWPLTPAAVVAPPQMTRDQGRQLAAAKPWLLLNTAQSIEQAAKDAGAAARR
jgi:hypothetical protein